ncbi:TetR/AcrR family transcriptional regulator [Actinomadura rudentiformis]|uniref:TetR/AcrR family transcriptional regulator n=1 Tax=Actinomadura rudentiformis TaxID=359158 RepID=A0A6H9YJR0_9ACTN|nr:TetR/AcrR family transcriptional regulator [Actinomadura rudentiformis]KAB2339305.1 TetR/AcrR family transcriptional regulator [Actinomadura rudentiformis]
MSDVKSGRRERYAALTRAAVLDAAKELFVAKGFEATSVEEIARLSETSKGAVYHHFSDKREIFAEVFRGTQLAVMQTAIASTGDSGQPWDRVEAATRAFLRSYVADDDARALLRQAIEVLGWSRVRALDEETALPLLRATLEEFVQAGVARPLPIDAATQLLFSLYCNAVLFIAADDSDVAGASRDIETVIFALLRGLKAPPPDSTESQ